MFWVHYITGNPLTPCFQKICQIYTLGGRKSSAVLPGIACKNSNFFLLINRENSLDVSYPLILVY